MWDLISSHDCISLKPLDVLASSLSLNVGYLFLWVPDFLSVVVQALVINFDVFVRRSEFMFFYSILSEKGFC